MDMRLREAVEDDGATCRMECKYLGALTVLLFAYLCIGAAVFEATESSQERDSIDTMLSEYQHFVGNHSCVTQEALTDFLRKVLVMVGPYGGLSRAKFDVNFSTSTSRRVWDFPGAFTFSITVVTTIGYGHIFPVSSLGRVACVVYALVGIPLTLIVLRGLGEQLNNIGRRMMTLKLCFQSATVNKVLNMFGVVLAGLLLMFIVPTIVFSQVEGWDVLKGIYFCFITLSTIGFGDFVAGNGDTIDNETSRNVYRVVVYLWILVGLAYLALIIKSISDLFVRKAEQVQKEAKKRVAATRLATMSTESLSTMTGVSGNCSVNSELAGIQTTTFRTGALGRMRLRRQVASLNDVQNVQLVNMTALANAENKVA